MKKFNRRMRNSNVFVNSKKKKRREKRFVFPKNGLRATTTVLLDPFKL